MVVSKHWYFDLECPSHLVIKAKIYLVLCKRYFVAFITRILKHKLPERMHNSLLIRVIRLCHASSFKDREEVKTFGTLATPCRRGCQTTLRCCSRKGMVVNGQRKAFVKRQVCVREMNASELLMK